MKKLPIRPSSRHVLALWLAFLLSNAPAALAGPDADELTWAVGIPSEELSKLLKGDIVSFNLQETRTKSLTSGIAMYVKAPPAKVVEMVLKGRLAASDPDVLARGDLDAEFGPDAFRKFAYGVDQLEEAKKLLDAKPGWDFNLSSGEIASFQALKEGLDQGNPKAVVSAVSANYRRVLWDRLKAYQDKGLSGIAGYDRGNGETTDIGFDLSSDTRNGKILNRYFTDLQQYMLRAPLALNGEPVDSRLFWINRRIEGRPTPILAHRLLYGVKDGALMVQREFYVAHDYNSSQAMAGSLPYEDGALVIFALRSYLDNPEEMGQSLQRSVSRDQLKAQMIKKFQRLKAALKS